MIKRNSNFLLIFILGLIFCTDINAATQGYVPRKVDIDRSNIPKNILVGSFIGGRSHVKPMLDVTAILAERGYNIILLASGNYTPSPEYPTLKQLTLGPNTPPRDFKNPGFHKELDHRQFSGTFERSLKAYNRIFEKYKNVAEEFNIDLFLCDAFVNDACLDAAQVLNKPVVGFSSHLSAFAPVTYKSDPIFSCNVSLENASFLERFRCTVIQPMKFFFTLSPFINRLNDLRKQIDVDSKPITYERLSKTTLALVDTFFGFELPQELPPNVREVGPILSEDYPPLTPELTNFMNEHHRVLYVAFGSNFFTTPENNNKVLKSIIKAIDKNLFDGVIWALSQTLNDEFSPTISLNDGTEIQTSAILNNEHPDIYITKFAPQFSVLNHTNTKLFFSHGGAGSAHESLYTGTPMLILPIFGDQMGNAEKLRSSGVALMLNKLDLNVDDIVNKMDLLLKDESVKKNLKRMEILAKINSKRKYGAADLIEYFLHSSSSVSGDVKDEFLKEWVPASTRMGFIKGNNLDVIGVLLGIIFGFIGGVLWVILRFIVKRNSLSASSKSKTE